MAHFEVLGGTDWVVNGSNPGGGKVFFSPIKKNDLGYSP